MPNYNKANITNCDKLEYQNIFLQYTGFYVAELSMDCIITKNQVIFAGTFFVKFVRVKTNIYQEMGKKGALFAVLGAN